MKYLVTGGVGFIGVNFVEKLLENNNDVIIVDNLSRKGSVANLSYIKDKYPKVEFVHADIRVDYEKLLDLMDEVDFVFHLAGQVAVTTSVKFPQEDFSINAFGTMNILEAVRNSKRKPALLYASTNKVYGGMEQITILKDGDKYTYGDRPSGITEEELLDFHSPYGCSKGSADQYVRDYARIYNLKTVVMRQSCIYGERQFGIEDQGWVTWFTIAALLNKPITIYGDGMQVRDVLYVGDLFDAWNLAVININKVSGQVFNIGGGPKNTLSLLELVNFLEEFLCMKIPLTYDAWRPGDQKVYISGIDKASKKLGWKPKVSPKQGVEKLTAWVRENSEVIQRELA